MSAPSIAAKRILTVLLAASMLVGPLAPVPAAAAPPASTPAPLLSDRVRPDVFRGQFRLAGAAQAGEPLDLAFTINPIIDLDDVSVELILPDGMQVVSGSATWQGRVRAGETVERRLTLTVPAAGEWDVRAAVDLAGQPGLSRVYVTYISIAGGQAKLSASAAQATYTGHKAPMRMLGTATTTTDEPALAPGAAVTTGTATVTGTALYETDAGFKKPIRDTLVELWESGVGRLASARTNNSGYFTLRATITGSKTVFVVFWCETTASVCYDTSWYEWYGYTDTFTVSPGVTTNLGTGYFGYTFDPFEANDHALDEYRWVSSNGGGWTRSQVSIIWPTTPTNDPLCGGWPCSTGDEILLPYQTVSPWWDRATVLHEYAHTVMYAAYGDFPDMSCHTGGHYIFSETCESYAITEGFAEFMESAVDNNPANTADVTCSGYENIENNTWELGEDCTADNSGAIVEGAVASIFWDVFDTHNQSSGDPDRDNLALGFDEIWRILRTYKPQGINAFYSDWLLHYGYASQMNLIFTDHGVDKTAGCLAGDAGGTFESATLLDVPADKEGYICPAGDDEDWYRFSVLTGEVINATLSSLPGDYDLFLYKPDGTGATLSGNAGTANESLSFTADVSGEWRLRVVGYAGASSGTDSYLLHVDIGGCSCGDNGVVLYRLHDYNGSCITLTESQPSLASVGFDNMAASIKLVGSYAGDWEAILYDSVSYAGTSTTFSADDPDLANNPILRGRASSVRVRLRIPPAPTGLSASDNSSPDWIALTWDATPRAESYLVYRYTSNSPGSATQIGTSTEPSYNDVTATPGKTYWYWVKARNGTGTSGFSAGDSGMRLLVPPPAPENVAATDGTLSDRVRITWSPAFMATSYEVYRMPDGGDTPVLIRTTTSTSFDDTTAARATIYHYSVRGVNSAGCGGYSVSDPGYRMQAAPGSVSASDGTYSEKVRITWTAAVSATTYTVYRNTANNHTGETVFDPVPASPYEDTSAVPGITYYYWVRANNGAYSSAYSAVNSGWRKLLPPANVAASDNAYSDRVQVTWAAAEGADSYDVYRYTSNSSGSATKIGTAEGTSYDDTTAYPGKTYWYWVKAKNVARTSAFSAGDSGMRLLLPPAAPGDVAASDGTYGDRIRVTWTATWTATSYDVYRDTDGDSAGATLVRTTTGTSYDDTAAAKGTIYWYWVIAKNAAGVSDLSAGDSGYKQQAVPTGVSASDGAYADKVRVTWVAASGATSYTVYRTPANNHTDEVELASVTAPPYDDTSAVPGTTYYYWVKANNAAYSSAYSASNSGYRTLLPPTDVSASDAAFTDKVQVTWTAAEGAESYEVYRYTSNSSGSASKIGTVTGTSYDDVTAVPGKTYWYWVKARNGGRTSSFSTGDSGSRLP